MMQSLVYQSQQKCYQCSNIRSSTLLLVLSSPCHNNDNKNRWLLTDAIINNNRTISKQRRILAIESQMMLKQPQHNTIITATKSVDNNKDNI